MFRIATVLGIIIMTLLPAAAANPVESEPSQEQTAEPSDGSLWKQIQSLYEAAKKAGDIDAGSVGEWLKSDYESVGDWEYRVIQVDSKDSSVLQTCLNTEGQDRWEVFWIREGSGDFTFFLKRPVRSYMRSIPLSDLLKLIPGGGGD